MMWRVKDSTADGENLTDRKQREQFARRKRGTKAPR